MNKKQLLKFTEEIAQKWESGKIKSPVHLSRGNEQQLIKIFEKLNIRKNDWIFSTWRSHYHWLLSGRNANELKEQILSGHSMHIFGKRFFTSAIVGGIAPIALGVALALKRKKSNSRVFCFLGDMAYSGGLTKESVQYSQGYSLPITFIIEDNGLSVDTPTQESWGLSKKNNIIKYKYKRVYKHAGAGKFVLF